MGKRQFFKTFLVLAAIFFTAFTPTSLGAQSVERWFAKPTISESYGNLKLELLAAANELEQLSLSDDLLISRLEEGAGKNVSAPVLLAAINADMDYIRMIVQNLAARNLFPSKRKDALKTVQNSLLLLRTGIGQIELETALDLASSIEGIKGKQSSILSRAFTALGVTASAQAVYGLSEKSRLELVGYLITSEMAERKFDSVMNQIAENIKQGESAEAAVASLEHRGNEEGEPRKSTSGREKSKGSENSAVKGNSGPGTGGGSGDGPSNSGQVAGSGPGAEAGPGQGPASNQGDSSSDGTSPGVKPTTSKKRL